jgi:hypothetical protein
LEELQKDQNVASIMSEQKLKIDTAVLNYKNKNKNKNKNIETQTPYSKNKNSRTIETQTPMLSFAEGDGVTLVPPRGNRNPNLQDQIGFESTRKDVNNRVNQLKGLSKKLETTDSTTKEKIDKFVKDLYKRPIRSFQKFNDDYEKLLSYNEKIKNGIRDLKVGIDTGNAEFTYTYGKKVLKKQNRRRRSRNQNKVKRTINGRKKFRSQKKTKRRRSIRKCKRR